MRPCLTVHLGLMEYGEAWALQKALVLSRAEGITPDLLLLLEHPPTYTIGRRGDRSHILLPAERLQETGIALYETDRGGQATYHGPGQVVGYPILDLRGWMGPLQYTRTLEALLIETVQALGVPGGRVEGLTGVWVGERKIAAIGVRISRGVAFHGFALNVDPNLRPFDFIVPCGIRDKGVTSLAQELGRPVEVEEVLPILTEAFARAFDFALRWARPEEWEALRGALPAMPEVVR